VRGYLADGSLKMKIEVMDVYYPEDYYWYSHNIKKTSQGFVIWIGKWKESTLIWEGL